MVSSSAPLISAIAILLGLLSMIGQSGQLATEVKQMKKIRMVIRPDTIKSLAVKDSKGKVIAYISVSGRNLMVSTEGWSDCTVEDITEMEELA